MLSRSDIAGDLNRMLWARNPSNRNQGAPTGSGPGNGAGSDRSLEPSSNRDASDVSPAALDSGSSASDGGVAPQGYQLTTNKGDKRRKVEWSDDIVRGRFRKRYNVSSWPSQGLLQVAEIMPSYSGRAPLLFTSGP